MASVVILCAISHSAMSTLFECLQEERVVPERLSRETLMLVPVDFYSVIETICFTRTVFFDADWTPIDSSLR